MNKHYAEIKSKLAAASDAKLFDLYRMTEINENSTTADILIRTALETEMENRGLIEFED